MLDENGWKLGNELNSLGEINESNIVKVSELFSKYLKTNLRQDTLRFLDLAKNCIIELFNSEPDEKKIKFYLERLIIGKLGSVIINSKTQTNFTGLMILTLVRNKQEPNYNIVPKLKIKKNTQINKLVSQVTSDHEEVNNILLLMQYLYQFDISLEKFINCLLVNELYNWFEENEPKTELWKYDFWEFTELPMPELINKLQSF